MFVRIRKKKKKANRFESIKENWADLVFIRDCVFIISVLSSHIHYMRKSPKDPNVLSNYSLKRIMSHFVVFNKVRLTSISA